MIYNGDKLKKISFPLGGIGAGSVSLAGNGQLIDWQILNRPNVNSENSYTHIAVRCINKEKVVDARVLTSDIQNNYNPNGTGASIFSMNGFPHFKSNTFEGKFPFCNLHFESEEFPAKVTLSAFSPFIPLDSKNSSLPVAIFEICFKNTTNDELDFEAAFSLHNPFGTSKNEKLQNGIILYDGQARENNLSIITDCKRRYTTDYWYRGWFYNFCHDNIRMFWDDFSAGKNLKDRNYTDNSKGDICTVSGRVTIPSKAEKRVRFILSWSIPTCYNYWHPLKDCNGKDVTWKNYYATLFESSAESAQYVLEKYDYLKGRSMDFSDSLFSSTIEDSVKEAVSAGLAVLKSPTLMRLEDGSLYGFEGSAPKVGSCEGTCQHVYNFAYACCYLFPDLEIGIRNNEFRYGVLENGESVIRQSIPFGRKEFSNLIDAGKKFIPCVDGHMGTIIKVYREWKLSGDNEWLKSNWDTVKRMLSFIWSEDNDQCWDTNCDGVLEGRQHHTLDLELFGPSGWLQGFYLTALKAAIEMANYLDDTDSAQKYKEIFEKGYKYTKDNLFNGEYFIQAVELADKNIVSKFNLSDRYWNEQLGEITHQIGNGCLIDQLTAQWHASLCGLGDVFDEEQAKKAAYSIFKNNYIENMRTVVNPWRLFALNDESGTIICSYPQSDLKPKIPIPYSEEVMSGFEYAFAGILAIYGYIDESVKVLKAVRARYDGEKRNPWNDSECGNYYVRSMASFALIPIYSGFVADLPNKEYTFIPRIKTIPFKSIWSVSTGWGEFYLDDNIMKITIKSGYFEGEKINIPYGINICGVTIDGKNISFNQEGNSILFKATANSEIVFRITL